MSDLNPDSSPPSRVDLLRLAQGLGVSDADVMTRAELRAAIDKARRPEPVAAEPHSITWVSVARRLLASVVERGLNLPDAAALIRGDTKLNTPPKAPPPVATVTLARIYAAQGHLDRAIATLKEVLDSDPDHDLANELRAQLEMRRAENHARANAAKSAATDDPSVTADSAPPASAASVNPDSAAMPRELASSPTVNAALANELVASAPESAGPATEAGPFAESSDAEPRYITPSDTPPSAAKPRYIATGDVATDVPSSDSPSSDTAPIQLAPSDSTPDEDASARDPSPPAMLGVDAAAELVAPPFDMGELDAGATEFPQTPAFYTEPPTMVGRLSVDSEMAAPPSLFPEAETEPPPTIATSVDLPPANEPEPHRANGVANGAALVVEPAASGAAPAPAPTVPNLPTPEAPGLVLIETDTPIRYVYWELSAPDPSNPHWIHVVTHTPTPGGDAERRERTFPVHRALGALRLEGLPAHAVVRAKLTHAPQDARPLVVASSVRPRALAGTDSFEIRYAPHPRARPEAIAHRAKPLLEHASPVYWD